MFLTCLPLFYKEVLNFSLQEVKQKILSLYYFVHLIISCVLMIMMTDSGLVVA